ncbi:hypothetical protein THAOC_00339, partial [Thalassiosira oceanica]
SESSPRPRGRALPRRLPPPVAPARPLVGRPPRLLGRDRGLLLREPGRDAAGRQESQEARYRARDPLPAQEHDQEPRRVDELCSDAVLPVHLDGEYDAHGTPPDGHGDELEEEEAGGRADERPAAEGPGEYVERRARQGPEERTAVLPGRSRPRPAGGAAGPSPHALDPAPYAREGAPPAPTEAQRVPHHEGRGGRGGTRGGGYGSPRGGGGRPPRHLRGRRRGHGGGPGRGPSLDGFRLVRVSGEELAHTHSRGRLTDEARREDRRVDRTGEGHVRPVRVQGCHVPTSPSRRSTYPEV